MSKELVIESCEKDNIMEIIDGINDFNLQQVTAVAPVWTAMEYSIKDGHSQQIGGIIAGIGYWNGLEIKILWVKDGYRNKGIGTMLLQHVERIAKDKGATVSMLDTFDFHAEDFYVKNGYNTIGEIKDFPPGHRRIYLSKYL